jgi:hypothetical protein
MIVKGDKERELYTRTFTGKDGADPRHYHLCIDTSRTGVDESVELILKYLTLVGATEASVK